MGFLTGLTHYSYQFFDQFQVINHEMNSRGIKQVFDITFSLPELRPASSLLFIFYFVWYTWRAFFFIIFFEYLENYSLPHY